MKGTVICGMIKTGFVFNASVFRKQTVLLCLKWSSKCIFCSQMEREWKIKIQLYVWSVTRVILQVVQKLSVLDLLMISFHIAFFSTYVSNQKYNIFAESVVSYTRDFILILFGHQTFLTSNWLLKNVWV